MSVHGEKAETRPSRRGAARSWRRRIARLPWWAQALAIYAGSRVISTLLLAATFVLATALNWHFASSRADPNFFTFLGSWDASFYKQVAEVGYPSSLPADAAGHVLPNPWAFLPGYPWLVSVLMHVTALPFYPAGVVVATVCGAGAALALCGLLRERTGARQARWATAAFCLGPVSFLLQVAYAESLFLLLMFAALWLLIRRHYLLIIPVAVAAAFTRPGVLALALALAIHLVTRFVVGDRPRTTQTLSIVAAGAVTAVAGLDWPAIASAVTSRKDAYVDTELSWWTGFVGRVRFAPLAPWFEMAERYLGAVVGVVVVVTVAAGLAWWLLRSRTRRLGGEIIAYSGSYALYLFAVFLPQQSLFRVALPLSPLLASDTFTRTRRRRRVLLTVAIALQPVAIVFLWFLGYP